MVFKRDNNKRNNITLFRSKTWKCESCGSDNGTCLL